MENNITSEQLGQMLTKAHGKVFKHILYKTYHDKQLTEDICYKAYERVINKVKEGEYKEENKFEAWVLIIAKNILTDHFRKESRFRNVSRGPIDFDTFIKYKEQYPDEWDEIKFETINIDKKIKKILTEQIEELPEEQAHIINLVFFKGYKFKQIAEEYDMSINTALGRMRYGLRNLRIINKNSTELSDIVLNQ